MFFSRIFVACNGLLDNLMGNLQKMEDKTDRCTVYSVTSIVVEQGSFQTELRIVGNSNKLVYFRHIDFKNLQH